MIYFCRRIITLNSKIRFCSTLPKFSEEYSVDQFCKLHINLPFNVKIRPLDVHKFPNNDKLFIKILSSNAKNKPFIDFKQDDKNIYITTANKETEDIKCEIEAPIVADLFVSTTHRGSIDIKTFRSDQVVLKSQSGDIISENCHNTQVEYSSETGNIVTNGTLHASNISLETKESGCIISNHLQALTTTIKSQDGDIRTKCCYSDESNFETETGKLILNNIHKKCNVNIHDCGILQMVGFDGTLNAKINEGEADIQLTKIQSDSNISMTIKSPILIRLAETLMDNTKIEAQCASLSVSDKIRMKKEKKDDVTTFSPLFQEHSTLRVSCPTSHVVFEEASWADMIGLLKRNF